MDDGADLVSLLHTERTDIPIMGSMEETTTGVIRLKSMEKNNKLRFPVVAVNDSDTKHLFDNRFGTGQSAMDGVVRATDLLIAGLNVVVIGFGDCGKGVAERAYGMGAKVTVVEPDSVRALEALMHGYEVKTSLNAAKIADVIISVTGNLHALDKQHFDVMKDGVALANAGHFDVEINLEALKNESTKVERVREHVESYKYKYNHRDRVLRGTIEVNKSGHGFVTILGHQNDVFITIPGYEWSGNTSLGGDRNVFFPEEDRIIRRSSHAMIEDKSDIETDCTTAKDLFNSLYTNNELDALVYAHCGGRYADIKYAHDGRFEKSIEIHSSWGTFEWILTDAFEEGYRVGIVGNSDGHKGRPGSSYPGSSLFGAVSYTHLTLPTKRIV
mgnify:CR=1 FL=1